MAIPQNPYRAYQYALQLENRQQHQEAESVLQTLIKRHPTYLWLYRVLGQFYERQEQQPAALDMYHQGLNAGDDEQTALALGALYLRMGDGAQTLTHSLPLLLSPTVQVQALQLVSQALLKAEARAMFAPIYDGLRQHQPASAGRLAYNLADCYERLGFSEEAEALYHEALTCCPRRWDWRLRQQFCFPAIAPNRACISTWHTRMEQALQDTLKLIFRLTDSYEISDFLGCLWPLNNVAYHDQNVKKLRQIFGQLATQVLPLGWDNPTPIAQGPFHLGLFFAATSLKACQWCYQSVLNAFDPIGYRITVFSTEPQVAALFGPGGIQHPQATYQVVSSDFVTACKQIRQSGLTAMLFTEPCYSPLQYYLACRRVAPRQYTSVLNPGTSGLIQINGFLSSTLAETEAEQQYYTEALIRLPTPPLFMLRQQRSQPLMTRADFGLPLMGSFLVCPQNPFKFHPDFDAILGRILEQQPDCFLVMVAVKAFETFRDRLLQRFRCAIPHVMERIWVLPQLTQDQFLHLLSLADVMLDTFHSGGGSTSSYGFGMGVPIVTWPAHENIHGKITAMIYRRMGITDCIAANPAHYVELVLRLLRDPDFYVFMRQSIAAKSDIIFDSPDTAEELCLFFERDRLKGIAS